MNRLERNLFRCAAAVVLASGLGAFAGAEERPNVLFISIDDLRNHLGCLGVEHAQTPHLDALAVAEAGELLRGSVYTQLRPRPGTLAAMADLLEQLDTEVWQEPSFRDFAEVVRGAIKARPYRGGAAR